MGQMKSDDADNPSASGPSASSPSHRCHLRIVFVGDVVLAVPGKDELAPVVDLPLTRRTASAYLTTWPDTLRERISRGLAECIE